MGGDAEENRAEEAGQKESSDEASDDAQRSQLESAAEDELKNVRARGAERHADADLFVTLRHEICDDAVDAETGEGQREDGEDRNQPGAETRLRGRIVDQRFHGVHFHDGIWVHRAQSSPRD